MKGKSPSERFKITFTVSNPHIHPEDYARALVARLDESLKGRQKANLQRIIEDAFISSIANIPSGQKLSELQARKVAELMEDQDFVERLLRAKSKGKTPLFDKYDNWILMNWRELHLPAGAKLFRGNVPGLRHWSPKAVAGLLEHAQITPSENLEGWYKTRRNRLVLTPIRPYAVIDYVLVEGRGRVKLRRNVT